MSIYKENIEIIKRDNPSMFNLINAKLSYRSAKNERVNISKSKINGSNLKVELNDEEFTIHSTYDSIMEGERWAQSINTKAASIIILGLGLGYHIEALKRKIGKNIKIIIIEPDIEIFRCFLNNRKVNDVFDERTVILLDNEPEVLSNEVYSSYNRNMLDDFEIRIFSGYEKLYGELFNSIQKSVLSRVKTTYINIRTTEVFKERWLVNFFVNIIFTRGTYNGKAMAGMFKDIPAIIVSAGPSLNKNVKQLEGLKNKALILAGGSAIGGLSKNDIKPHFMVAMDPSPLEKDIFQGIDFSGISLIYLNRLYNEITEEYSENKILFSDTADKHTKHFAKKMHLDLQQIPPDQTVAGINVGLASYFGCNPIIFVGQDYCYPNMEMHAEGAAHMRNFAEEIDKNPDNFLKLKDIYGNDVYTINALYSPKLACEDRIRDEIKKGYKFINATEGGLGLENCPNVDLSEAVEKYMQKDYNISAIIKEFLDNKENGLNVSLAGIREYLDYVFSEAEKLDKASTKIYNNCIEVERLFEKNEYTKPRYSELSTEINDLDAEINASEFFNEFLLGSIEQNIALHRMVMEKGLKNTQDSLGKNIIKLKSLKNQSIEIISACKNIETIKEVILKTYFK